MPLIYTTTQAARKLFVSPVTLHKMIKSGQIDAYLMQGWYYISESEIRRVSAEREKKRRGKNNGNS